MHSNKRSFDDMDSEVQEVRHKKPKLKLEDAPAVHSIHDLIELGRTIKFYRNLDTIMLWRITPYLEQLEKMVGMHALKETIFYQVVYYLQGMHTRNKNEEYLHTVIYGPPGHGKTEIAKIIAKLYQAMGVLSKDGPFKTAYRDDLIAGYLGQTATKTKKLLNSCLGGVLLIDEVYSLAPRQNDRDSFAKEAIDTICGFLSEHKNDFCCIIAGYEEEVQSCFFNMNRGLERRFPWVHRIDKYSAKELCQIFMKKIKEIEWETSFEEPFLISILESNKDLFKNAGGDIETFLSKCKMLHSSRVFSLAKKHKFVLAKEDITSAVDLIRKNSNKDKDSIPKYIQNTMYT